MKRISKRILLMLLTVILVAGLTPLGGMTALAEDDGPGVCYLKYYMDPADEEQAGYQTVEIGSAPVKPEDPFEEGKAFMGWFADKDLTDPFDFSKPLETDTNIYAKFLDEDEVVGVNFFLGPEEEYPIPGMGLELEKGAILPQPADPSNGDLAFFGWYSDRELKNKYDFSKPVETFLNLFARFVSSEDCYSVLIYLDAEDTEPTAGFEVPKGEPIPERDDPGREDATFAGWYTDRELTQPADFTAPRDEDVSLFPKFITEEDCYTVWVYLRPDDEEVTTGYDVPKGTPCSKPAEPGREGYEFLGWFTDKELTEPADFTTPRTEDVTLYGGWKLILPDNPFVDVKKTDYFSDPVLWALKKEITKGTDDTHFSPDAVCTRGQVVTFLWRAAGSPEPESAVNPFTDVNTDDYYCKAVLWAVKEGITKGTSDTTFGPSQSCTRGQVATFLYRAEGSPDTSLILNPFTDVTSDQYYYDAVLWAVMREITHGTANRIFSPDATCTRGQIVTFLFRDMA